MRVIKAQEVDAGQRADVFIAKRYPDFSRSSLDGLFDKGLVKLEKKPVKQAYKVKSGDKLRVDDNYLFERPADVELPILFEDDNVIVIDKPAGILTHAKGALNTEATVASFINPMLSKDMPKTNRAGIVHRLDRATSGVIITAKNPAALQWLQKQFSARKTKKIYLAVVEGEIEPPQAIIDAPIGRNPRKPQTFYISPTGKAALTEYKVLKTLNPDNKMLDKLSINHKASKPAAFSLAELKPLTGRTHQLRVHLAYIKHPILGDRLYGHAAEHLYLHAKSLELTLPGGARKIFETEPPAYITEITSDV